MIAPGNETAHQQAREHWRWYAKPIPFSDLEPKDWVIRKKPTVCFWWFARFERCGEDDIVKRRKTEINREVFFGRTPAYANISLKQIARHKSDVAQLGSVEASRTIHVRRKDTGEWTDIALGDCRAEDSILHRVKHQGEWESECFSRCEYNDFVACVDFKAILPRVLVCLFGLGILPSSFSWWC